MLESDRLVCEKNATKAQPVTNCNLGSINYVYFNYKVNLLIGREKILQHYGTLIDSKWDGNKEKTIDERHENLWDKRTTIFWSYLYSCLWNLGTLISNLSLGHPVLQIFV